VNKFQIVCDRLGKYAVVVDVDNKIVFYGSGHLAHLSEEAWNALRPCCLGDQPLFHRESYAIFKVTATYRGFDICLSSEAHYWMYYVERTWGDFTYKVSGRGFDHQPNCMDEAKKMVDKLIEVFGIEQLV
jgi:hypothetical protein